MLRFNQFILLKEADAPKTNNQPLAKPNAASAGANDPLNPPGMSSPNSGGLDLGGLSGGGIGGGIGGPGSSMGGMGGGLGGGSGLDAGLGGGMGGQQNPNPTPMQTFQSVDFWSILEKLISKK